MAPVNSNLRRIIDHTLYQLKHQYGEEVEVYKLQDSTTDYTTGEKSASKTVRKVNKCVVMPAQTVRKFFQGSAYVGAGKQFATQGGQGWDQDTRGFIFQGRDLIGYEWQKEDWIVHNNERYDIKSFESLEQNVGWLVMGTKVRGYKSERIIELNVVSTINMEQSAEVNE